MEDVVDDMKLAVFVPTHPFYRKHVTAPNDTIASLAKVRLLLPKLESLLSSP